MIEQIPLNVLRRVLTSVAAILCITTVTSLIFTVLPQIGITAPVESFISKNIPFYTPTPTDCAKLNERDSTPRLISISKIEIENNCLEAIGVADDGTLGDPKDAWVNIGYWLDPSPNYVKDGVAVFTCHTSFNPDRLAVCNGLARLAVEDIIIVELNSGQKKTYQIREVKEVRVDEVDMSEFITAVEPNKESLSIMTCTGVYNMKTGSASHRLLIRASLTDSDQKTDVLAGFSSGVTSTVSPAPPLPLSSTSLSNSHSPFPLLPFSLTHVPPALSH